MKEITLTKEQYNDLPYKGTKISRAKTYGDIIGMLESNGIEDYQWTKLEGSMVLAFPLKIKRIDMEVACMVKLSVPRLVYPLGNKYNKTITYLENESWRIFWWYLKSKLEAVKFGISDLSTEFLYNISHALPNGQEVSIGELIIGNMQKLDKIALPDDSKRVFIEAEVVDK